MRWIHVRCVVLAGALYLDARDIAAADVLSAQVQAPLKELKTIPVPVAHEAGLPGEGQLVLPVAAVVHRRQSLRLELYLTVAGIANVRVYYNGEIKLNTHKGVTFVCECPFSFAIIPCTMSFVELQNSLCENIQSHISKRVSNILYRNHVQVFDRLIQFQLMSITDDACMQQVFYIYQQTQFHMPMIELYVEFE
ncbi:hypothetical protein Ahy_B09g099507 isoform B [Arachis hypogaea]|uniref:Uncharacterized protein n=1 Tax=Arachis hypogaea TaxID=3818 RepID=A0A444XTY8_ARAHY|nr:hypothetical protein Ahy_B09g099507 isoform B [Arachis hypogaea]